MSRRDLTSTLNTINRLPKVVPDDMDEGDATSKSIIFFPPEIWSAIFEDGKIMSEDSEAKGEDCSLMDFLLTISHTCQFFRKVALGSPRLWTSIQTDGFTNVDWLSECIQRSQSCLLDIRIQLAGDNPQTDDARLGLVLDRVIPVRSRWRSLEVGYVCERLDFPMIRRLCNGPAPELQHLSMQLNGVFQEGTTIINTNFSSPQIFIDGTPKLKFARLQGFALHLFRPQLNTVVTLHLDQTIYAPLSYNSFRLILGCSPILTNLSVYGDIIGRSSWPRGRDPITLLNLRSLRICGEAGDIYAGLLMGIDAPLLESLTLKNLQEFDLDPLWELMDSDRYTKIRSLVFSNCDLSAGTYQRIFRTFQGITTFALLFSSIIDNPLVSLLLQGSIKRAEGRLFVPWPQLKEVVFSFEDEQDEHYILQKLLAVRRTSGFPLERIGLVILYDSLESVDIRDESDGEDGGAMIRITSRHKSWPPDSIHVDYDDTLFP